MSTLPRVPPPLAPNPSNGLLTFDCPTDGPETAAPSQVPSAKANMTASTKAPVLASANAPARLIGKVTNARRLSAKRGAALSVALAQARQEPVGALASTPAQRALTAEMATMPMTRRFAF